MQLKLTNQQILTLEQAINSLDAKPYKISALARLALARNAGTLAAASTAFNRAKSALVTQHGGEKGEIGPAHGNWTAFVKDYEELLHAAVEIDLHQIGLDELKTEANEAAGTDIPINVLTALFTLVKSVSIN